jgi:hypothetical protein
VIDAALVGRKALLITRDLADLAPLAQKPLTEYLTDPRDELVAERLLERIVGRMIDVNYHLLLRPRPHIVPVPEAQAEALVRAAGRVITQTG